MSLWEPVTFTRPQVAYLMFPWQNFLDSISFLSMCLCTFVLVYVSVCDVHTFVKTRGWYWGAFHSLSPPYIFRQSLSTNLELIAFTRQADQWTLGIALSLASASQVFSTGCMCQAQFLCECWWSKIRSLCMPCTNWAISPAPVTFLKVEIVD